ncbi:DUF6126 family protein [Streptomyces sp. NPDC102278]|uniref:DUF6126 family protein n=1 Tax=Streptomyces sp. NPDC102278 TaxID=3366152 RepID=UPI0037F6E4C0
MPQGENVTATASASAPANEVPHVPANEVPTGPAEQAEPTRQPETGVAPDTLLKRIESKFPRGLIIRLIAYLFVGHLFAFFVYLLFVLGAENQ